ncbi:hypothetical protein Tco_1085830 [Tanacetum coccineum]
MVKLRKIADTWEGEEESVMSTQEYIRKVIKDVGEDHDFTRGSWLCVVEYVNVDGGIMTGVLEMSRNFSRMGNLRKLLQFSRIGNSECVGRSHRASLILHNVSVFSPEQSTRHYLNTTKKNMVKLKSLKKLQLQFFGYLEDEDHLHFSLCDGSETEDKTLARASIHLG